ncbi:MAG: hypothetical protein K2K80_07705, partial [Clostridia bacterium]|nr:hypothetical protein [Clostridia bacterium]
MNIIGIAILAVVAFSAVLGLIIGLCKGFSRVSSWGMEYLLACLCTILIGGALKENVGGLVAGIISIVIGVASILIFGSTSSMCRAIFRRSKRKKVAQGKKEKGPSGFVDVIFGGVTLAVKGAVITGFIFAFMLAALDLSQLNFGSELAALCASEQYALFKPYLFDCFYLVFIFFAIKFGYRNGISNVVWSLIMIGLVVFAALAAYNLAFNVQSFDGVVASLAEKVQGLTASIEGFLGDSAANLNETI